MNNQPDRHNRFRRILLTFAGLGPLVGIIFVVASSAFIQTLLGHQPADRLSELVRPSAIALFLLIGLPIGLIPALLSGLAVAWLDRRRDQSLSWIIAALVSCLIGTGTAALAFPQIEFIAVVGAASAVAGAVCMAWINRGSRTMP